MPRDSTTAAGRRDRPLRILYIAGPGDLVSAHRAFRAGEAMPSEVSLTFSGQIAEALRDLDCQLWMQSCNPRVERLVDGAWILENLPEEPNRARGIAYYLVQLRRTLGIVRRVLGFRADILLIDTGRALWFGLVPLRWLGVSVIPILHNTFWPAGHRPTNRKARALHALDRLFWRSTPVAALAVSPEIRRQLLELAGPVAFPVYEFLPQFLPTFFESIPPTPPWDEAPFRVLFAGRVEPDKGVLDLVEMARLLEERRPGTFAWEICGDGSALPAVRKAVAEHGLEARVDIRGRLGREDMAAAYGRAHAVLVPTRDSFTEGFAMVVAEAVLSGRPCVTNPVVPALELLGPACCEARTNDVESYVAALTELATDRALYERKRAACADLRGAFFDPARGLTAKLREAMERTGRGVAPR